MALQSTPQEPLNAVKSGAARVWRWLTYPWTWGVAQTANLIDEGPVGQQLRNLDGRAQVHGAAMEIISAQIGDIARDQGQILKLLDRQTDMFARLDAALGRLTEIAQDAHAVRQDVAHTRSEFADGVRQVQLALAQEAASTRAKLTALPSVEHVQTLFGQSSAANDLTATRAELGGELRKLREAFDAQGSGVHGGVSDELTAARRELVQEIASVRSALSEAATGLLERLAGLPSADQIHAMIDTGVARELAAAKEQLAEDVRKVHNALAAATADVGARIATLPSAADVHALVGETVMQELASARSHTSEEVQRLRQAFAQETSGVHERLAALPSVEQIDGLLGGGAVAQQLAATRTYVSDALQKVHQVLSDHGAALAALPSTEQVHAFVEGGTANSIQSARRMFAEETQRGQAAAERMTKKLDFLQSRSVIPLTAQGLVMCRNPLGFLAVPADDLATIGSLADGVLPEQGTMKVVEKFLKPGGTFVDVGANVGLFTLLAARIVGPSGKVVAIEPAPATAHALCATVHANGIGDVVTVQELAAGAERGLGTLSVAQNSTMSTLHAPNGAASTVVATIAPLDGMLDGLVPDMVKIDVEGSEANVVEGMKAILRANPNVIVLMDFEPAHIRSTGLSAAAWVDRLQTAGFDIFEIDERNGDLAPLRKTGLEEIVSVNVVIARGDPSRRNAETSEGSWLRLGSGAQALPT